MNLNPSAADLLTLTFNPAVWGLLVLAAALYFRPFLQARRTPQGRQNWPVWKAVLFVLALLSALWALDSSAAVYTLNSMALYMVRLMVLAELVPPLLLLSLPRGTALAPRSVPGRLLSVLLDPWVAFAVWTAVILFWNIPAGFNASIVTNTASILLPALYLISGTMIWGAMLRPFPTIQPGTFGKRGWFGFLAALPMMSIAAWWLYAREVLYQPYVGAVCLWNLTPLQNQQISGWIMMLAGLPALGLAVLQLMAWLIEVSDGGGQKPQPRS
ncbi:Cytochrome c oxidase caa3-type, assembly factor CtaG-related protein [Deinococcus proteolyticus MRP]|uniref:Cytochrome c oxidase caa3-type, assembly factor CtaG-related protein n=1 Tax=Deinococcus proteolyticus (strain ATCC 35074 / DSM 20540 / JCM 6276 / NBRC 101906 / NCIMB 13154 / VKM Ac-1939 / CCM 2703 / MRP) TaxID=693977 RepID=F0RNF2_DEIPM|nr:MULTISPECIES: cytochrome c oxidase assembly protein [Deinococcus]ADY25254.1 Cytochrome c oxidase caa3-type, assembly factor CtaG-related protein [Deinococcus proteolyticus MRP]MCY1703353.1 cytochrome c oxidase assembly protein [Deinococcus sp. SL84]